jgi:hypothetical protein
VLHFRVESANLNKLKNSKKVETVFGPIVLGNKKNTEKGTI